jgi:hypothetical protein
MRHDQRRVKPLPGALAALALLAGATALVLVLAGGAGARVSARHANGARDVSRVGKPSSAQANTNACGNAAPETLAQTIGWVASRIYDGEVDSSETIKDRLQVERYAPLLEAMAKGRKAAIEAAVTSLVYSGTHIVRLRVLTGKRVLADVGGPYILAPLHGTLSWHGHVVGHYVMSVQDDVGYVKIETRFVGAPVVLRIGAKNVPIEYVLTPGPMKIPEHGPVTYRRVVYQAYSFEANRFPSGPLRISVLVPLPAGLAKEPCSAIKSSELAVVARRISGQLSLSPGNFQTYVNLVHTDTNGLLYVRSGSRQLAGSTRPGPAKLPVHGTVRYHGSNYEVFSFQAPTSVGRVRIYSLFAE